MEEAEIKIIVDESASSSSTTSDKKTARQSKQVSETEQEGTSTTEEKLEVDADGAKKIKSEGKLTLEVVNAGDDSVSRKRSGSVEKHHQRRGSSSFGTNRSRSNSEAVSPRSSSGKKNPDKANDILLLSSLTLNSPDWETWQYCNPTQMWHYIPLLLRVGQYFPDEFYKAIKPLFHHPKDQSIRQLAYWLTRLDLFPADAKQIFGEPEPDLLATGAFFDQFKTQSVEAGYEETFTTPICDPVFGTPSTLVSLKVLKLFKAHTRPALCEVTFSNPQYEPRRFIYKEGDDLSDDMYTQAMFFIFNQIWEYSTMRKGFEKPFIHLYRVFPTSESKGFVEFVASTTIQTYKWSKLHEFNEKERSDFIRSAAGAFAGAFILGIRDRHRDNMMISDKGHFFHIDFGYMFNNKTWFDANRFAIPSEIRTYLPKEWDNFLKLIGEAYRMLRRQRGLITYLVSRLFSDQPSIDLPTSPSPAPTPTPAPTPSPSSAPSNPLISLPSARKYKEAEVIKCLSGAFYEAMTEDEAVLHVIDIASKGEASPKKALKDLVHKIESKKKKI